ncbi:MAG: SDR family NAD(P)-dependent oxidoreductase, partial [Phycisphaerae bacterium]
MPQSESHSTNLGESNSQPYASASLFLKMRRPLIILAHIIAFAASLFLSFLVANSMQLRTEWLGEQYPVMLALVLVIKVSIFGLFKQYRGWWRYVSITDLFDILRASLISTLILVVLWYLAISQPFVRRTPWLEHLPEVSQGVFMADMFGTLLLLAGMRMLIRLYHEEFRTVETGRLKRFLIVGAGNAGESLLREIHRMPVAQYEVIGFIDDDPAKQGMSIHGISVLGNVDRLAEICKEHEVDEIAIAMPSATHQQMRHVIQVCEGAKIRFRTVPSITDIASGKFRVSQIRDVDINDLLGREAVQLDLHLIEEFLRGKVILVTGAGGSIGSEMCRQVCNFEPKLLLLVEQAENPLFIIDRELREAFPNIETKAVICDITDKIRVEQLFEQYKPQVVI